MNRVQAINRLWLVIGFMALLAGGPVMAQKPPKGGGGATPPPPNLPGIIFHLRQGVANGVWAVRPDGSGLTQAIPYEDNGGLSPTFYAQGSNPFLDRWYIERRQTGVYSYIYADGVTYTDYPHRDLFAKRLSPTDPSVIESVQLTDLYGIALLTGVEPGWSGDSNESTQTSFIWSQVLDIRESFRVEQVVDENGEAREITSFVVNEPRNYEMMRLPTTASEITTAWQSGAYAPFRPSSAGELEDKLWPIAPGYTELTPDARFLVELSTGSVRLLDPMTTLSVFTTWDGSTMGVPTQTSGMFNGNQANIAPDSTRIAVLNYPRTSEGGVWILTLDGSRPPLQIAKNSSKGSSYADFDQVVWSPDSNYIMARRHSYSGSTGHVWDQWIIPAGGGAPVLILPKSPIQGIRWVSSQTAP